MQQNISSSHKNPEKFWTGTQPPPQTSLVGGHTHTPLLNYPLYTQILATPLFCSSGVVINFCSKTPAFSSLPPSRSRLTLVQLKGLGSAASSISRVRDKAPSADAFQGILHPGATTGDATFCTIVWILKAFLDMEGQNMWGNCVLSRSPSTTRLFCLILTAVWFSVWWQHCGKHKNSRFSGRQKRSCNMNKIFD